MGAHGFGKLARYGRVVLKPAVQRRAGFLVEE
jgi:hypothetical protein